jgi:hypothetical protein
MSRCRKLKRGEHRYISESGRRRISRSRTRHGEERFLKKYDKYDPHIRLYSTIDLEKVKADMVDRFKKWASETYRTKDGKSHRNLKGWNNISFSQIENGFGSLNVESDGSYQLGSEGTHGRTSTGKGRKAVFKLRMDHKQKRMEIYIRGRKY